FAPDRVASEALELDEDLAATVGIALCSLKGPAVRDSALTVELLHRESIRSAGGAAPGEMRRVARGRGFGQYRGGGEHGDAENGFTADIDGKAARRARRSRAVATTEESRRAKESIAQARATVIGEPRDDREPIQRTDRDDHQDDDDLGD